MDGMKWWAERRNRRTPTKYGNLGEVESLGSNKPSEATTLRLSGGRPVRTATFASHRNGGGERNRRRAGMGKRMGGRLHGLLSSGRGGTWAEGSGGAMVGPEWGPAVVWTSMGVIGSPAAPEATIRDLRKKRKKRKKGNTKQKAKKSAAKMG